MTRDPVTNEPIAEPWERGSDVHALPSNQAKVHRGALIAVMLGSFVVAFWIASALWAGLLFGLSAAFALEPLHRRLKKHFPRHPGISAGLITLLLGLAMLGLLVLIVAILIGELNEGIEAGKHWLSSIESERLLSASTQGHLSKLGLSPERIAERTAAVLDRGAVWASSAITTVVESAVGWFGGTLIALITAYYTLKDGRPLGQRLQALLPLHPHTTGELIEEFRRVGRGTLIGTVLAGIIQGVFASVGYAIGGAPRAVLLGIVTAAASLLPIVGTLLVWVPLGAILIFTGHPVSGLFQLAWGALVTTSLVDYVLRPRLVGRESRAHPLALLVGLIGGVEVLGAAGLIAGPIAMAFFLSVVKIYQNELLHDAA